ncbi:MAG: hypothetical protein ABH824_05925 [Nanoarchaeota archaeon]
MSLTKEVIFIVLEEKMNEFRDLIDELELNFNDKLNFKFNYLYNIEEWKMKQEKDLKEALTLIEKEKISAVAFNSNNLVIITNYFWEKCKDEQICIILHELGHIKYPLTKICTFLTLNNGQNCAKEFLADSFIKEVSSELASKRFEFLFKKFDSSFKIDLFGSKFDSDEFDALILNYFNLCYYKRLKNSDLVEKSKKLIEDKLSKWGLVKEDMEEITKHINEYLDSLCDWKMGESLKKCLEEIDSKLLSENAINITK